MADRTVANTATLDTLRTTYNSTAGDVGDISSLTGASGIIASSTDIVEAIVAMNTEVTGIKTGATTFQTKITFEGATDDAHETTLAVTDPTADRTITFPDASGTLVVTDATQTLTNKTLTAPVITSGVFNTAISGIIASSTDVIEAIVAMNTEVTAIKAGTAVFETKLTFEGDTDDAHETILAITDPTADRTITFPDASGTVVTAAATQTLTNKTLTSPTITSGVLNTAVSGSAVLDEDNMASDSATHISITTVY